MGVNDSNISDQSNFDNHLTVKASENGFGINRVIGDFFPVYKASSEQRRFERIQVNYATPQQHLDFA